MMLFVQEKASTDEYLLAIAFDYAIGARHNASAYTLLPTQGRPGLTRKFINTYLMKDGTAFTDRPGWQEMQFIEETAGRDPRLAQSIRTPATRASASRTCCRPISASRSPATSREVRAGSHLLQRQQRPHRLVGLRPARLPSGRGAAHLRRGAGRTGHADADDLDISVNKLRDRVGMPHLDLAKANANPDWYLASNDYGYPNVAGANKGVILEIRRERAIELLQEGTRLEDLCRWKAAPASTRPSRACTSLARASTTSRATARPI